MKARTLWLLAGLAIASLIAAGPAQAQCAKSEADMRALALRSDKVAEVDAYLQCYRYSERAPEIIARKKLLEEEAEYRSALQKNEIPPLVQFIITNPGSGRVEAARRRIDELYKAAQLQQYDNSALDGTALKSGTVADAGACRAACQAEGAACAGYSYLGARQACTLWRTVTRRTRSPATMSGTRERIDETAPPPPAARFDYYPGYELLGGDLASYAGLRQDECEARCAGEQRCLAYSYRRVQGACFLKQALVDRAANADAISVLKQGSAPARRPMAIYRDRDLTNPQNSPADYQWVATADVRECLRLCEQDAACRAFTYNQAQQACILKSSYGEVRDFPGAISGEKR